MSQETQPSSAPADLPSHAQVVVIGAGVIGCSAAYALAREGCREVVVLERKQIACGTSWHSLGFIGLLRASPLMTRLALHTRDLIPELERETGRSTGFSGRGSINITALPERMESFRRIADVGCLFDMEVQMLSRADAERALPIADFSDMIGGIGIPLEGQVNPMDLVQTYVSAARARGARFFEETPVTEIAPRPEGGFLLSTAQGSITCETVLNCTGFWARDFGRGGGFNLPVQAVRHNYLVTEAISTLPEGLPLLRDMDTTVAFREDARQLSIGFNEPIGQLFAQEGVPPSFCFDQCNPDWDIAEPYIEDAVRRMPVLSDAGIRMYLSGPEAVTPDTRYMLGPVPEHHGYYVATGFSGMGVGSSGGAGQAIAEWILGGAPQDDLWELDVRRFPRAFYERDFLLERAGEASGKLYQVNWPNHNFKSGRGRSKTPFYNTMKTAGARFGDAAGWEVAEWFASTEVSQEPNYTFFLPSWADHARTEVRSALSGIGLCDRSHTAKFSVTGAGATQLLADLTSLRGDIPVGGATHAPVVNEKNGVESMWTIIRESEAAYLLLAEPDARVRDLDILSRKAQAVGDVTVRDETTEYFCLELIGPDATTGRAVADRAGAVVIEDKRFPIPVFHLLGKIADAKACLEALRSAVPNLSFLGSHARHAIWTNAGVPIWPMALNGNYTITESGLAQASDDTLSRRCLVRISPKDPNVVLLGNEQLWRGTARVGILEQAAYALVSDCAVGLGYVESDALTDDLLPGMTLLVSGRETPVVVEPLICNPARVEECA